MQMTGIEKGLLTSPLWGAVSRRLITPWVLQATPLPQRADVLDLGCGMGAETEAIARRFPEWRITATDVDDEMVSIARHRLVELAGRVSVERADATSLPYGDAVFDLCVSVGVWHHVGDWRRATEEVARVLRPAGSLLLADVPAPLGIYSVADLRATLADAGFRRTKLRDGRLMFRLLAEKGV